MNPSRSIFLIPLLLSVVGSIASAQLDTTGLGQLDLKSLRSQIEQRHNQDCRSLRDKAFFEISGDAERFRDILEESRENARSPEVDALLAKNIRAHQDEAGSEENRARLSEYFEKALAARKNQPSIYAAQRRGASILLLPVHIGFASEVQIRKRIASMNGPETFLTVTIPMGNQVFPDDGLGRLTPFVRIELPTGGRDGSLVWYRVDEYLDGVVLPSNCKELFRKLDERLPQWYRQ